MSDQTFPKLLATPWPEVLARAALTGECAAVIQHDTDAAAAIARLEAAGFLTEAAKLMAHALPRRTERLLGDVGEAAHERALRFGRAALDHRDLDQRHRVTRSGKT